MSGTWIILIHDLAPDQATWSQFDAGGALLFAPKTGSLLEAAQSVKEDPVTLVLPAAQVTHHTVQVPVQNKRQALAALPYSIEDKLAQDITQCHVAAGAPLDEGRYPLAVVSSNVLAKWLQPFEDEGCLVHRIISEHQVLPRQAGVWTLAFNDGHCHFVLNANEAYVFDRSWWQQGVREILDAHSGEPPVSLVYGATDALKTDLTESFPELETKFRTHTGSWLELIAPAALAADGINLAQQAFKPHKGFKGHLKIWKPALSVVAGVLAFVIGHDLLLFNQVTSKIDGFTQQSEALYRDLFPQDKRIVNLKAQTENNIRQLKESHQEGQLFLLFGTLGEAIAAEASSVLLSVAYNRLRTGLSVEVETSDYQAFERLRKSLTKKAVVKVRTANVTDGNRVRGAFTLSLRAN